MPKWRINFDESRLPGGGGGKEGGGGKDSPVQPRQRSRTVFSMFKSKLGRHRSSSDVDERERDGGKSAALPLHVSPNKCATLPGRVSDNRGDKAEVKTLFWMEQEYLEALKSLDSSKVTRKGSDESVDSGFEPKVEGGSESDGSPHQSKSLVPQRSPCVLECRYDQAAVERAFGPMKDIGRWYSSHQQSRARSEKIDLDENEERLASRPPLPPPRHEFHLFEDVSASDDGVYERIECRMMGANGLMLGLRDLACHGWYWGPVTRVEAEEKLFGADDGTFLVRDSSDERYLLSLSFRSQGKTLHTRIEYSNGYFSFYSFPDSDSEGYRSIVELIEQSVEYSREGVFCFSRARALGSPAVPVRLLTPLSRFNQVRSLQHYCRFVIRQSIRFDRIRQLPLPRHVHGFLEQSHY